MLSKTVKYQILNIKDLVLEVNSKKKNTVFFRFSGHCEIFEVTIYSKGWKEGLGADFFKDIYFSSSTETESRQKLDESIEKLENLKKI